MQPISTLVLLKQIQNGIKALENSPVVPQRQLPHGPAILLRGYRLERNENNVDTKPVYRTTHNSQKVETTGLHYLINEVGSSHAVEFICL